MILLHATGKNGIPRIGSFLLSAAVLAGTLLIAARLCPAQTTMTSAQSTVPVLSDSASASKDKGPLTDKERAEFLKLIKDLQDRVSKLEAAQAVAGSKSPNTTSPNEPSTASAVPVRDSSSDAVTPNDPPIPAKAQTKDQKYGRYTPNFGYKVADTEFGDMSISIYTYARYLNQLGLNETYVDAFGNTKTVQNRQDFQLNKMQIKFLGWIMSPKLRYFLYAWTSNANQGLGAQVVLAGNLNYTFNKHITFGAGITGLPGTRSIEGIFPFWLGVDSRMIADEFFRGSYTSGIWAKGAINDNISYQVMLGNNLSTLGVPANRIDNKFNTLASALVWTTKEFGQGLGDFEDHKKLATRLGFHYSRSDENKESQPNTDQFENTQLRLSDGTVIFTPDIFGPGVTVTDARYQMTNFDWGLKYRGYSFEGAYYMRWLDNFRGSGTETIARIFNQGYQVEAAAMLKPQVLQVYTGYSKIFGQQGNPWDFRLGLNFFPFRNKVVRWNNELLYLNKSPVGYTSVPFTVGAKGWVFHSTWELAF